MVVLKRVKEGGGGGCVVVVRCDAEAGAAWGRSAKGRRLWSGESGVVHHIEDACSDTPLWSTAYA